MTTSRTPTVPQGSSLDSFRGILRVHRDLFHPTVVTQSQRLFKVGRVHEVVRATAEYMVASGIWMQRIPEAAGIRSKVEPMARAAIAEVVAAYEREGGVVLARLGVPAPMLAHACFMCWSAMFSSPLPGPDIAMPEMDDPVVEARIVLVALKARELILEKARVEGDIAHIPLESLEGLCRAIGSTAYRALTDAEAVNHELVHGDR